MIKLIHHPKLRNALVDQENLIQVDKAKTKFHYFNIRKL